MNVVCCLQMQDAQVVNHLMPIALHASVNKLWIVRRKTVKSSTIPKATFVPVRAPYILSFPIIFMRLLWLTCSNSVQFIGSFYATPYGIISLIVGKLCRKPVHIGFVGDDWYRSAKGALGWLFVPLLRCADYFTCAGTQMRAEMIARGFPANRIEVLPHSIDLDKALISESEQAEYDCIFVGTLDDNKRVDTILQAFVSVRQRHATAQLCIVGTGPLLNNLINIAEGFGIATAVTFIGHTYDVFSYLARSRISIIASKSEGFPFAVVEAMCCGLVPVCTPVGTIPSIIKHGETGMLFPIGDHEALANCILSLLDNPELYTRIRTNVLALREQFSYERATAVWERFLRNVEMSITEL